MVLKAKRVKGAESPLTATRSVIVLESPTRKVSTKKTRLREEKERRKSMELYVRRQISLQADDQQSQLERQCREIVARSIGDLRHDLYTLESSVQARLASLDGKLAHTTTRMEELHAETWRRIQGLEEEFGASIRELRAADETERGKRLATAKKLSEKYESSIANMKVSFTQLIHEDERVVASLTEETRAQGKEIAILRDKLDDMMMNKFSAGHISRDNVVYDSLSTRLQKVESLLRDDLNGSLFAGDSFAPPMSPGRFSGTASNGGGANSARNTISRIRRLEENLFELQNQIRESESDIQSVKATLLSRTNSSVPHLPPSSESTDVRELEKKIRRLADNTTKACKSLSAGLSDVQQSTLTLYSWTDRVHSAFDTVSEKLSLPSNLCPRARVPSQGNLGKSFHL